MLWLLGGLSAIFLLAEILRMNISIFKHLFKRFFGPIVRVSESNKFTGATSVFISGFLTVLIFEKNIAIFAMLTLSLADATAALIGKKWGKRKLFDKTLEGSLTFLIVSIGLAADSYIVTFEKLKDEIKVGRSFEFAANKAVDESWKTILTADFVSLSAAFLLYILAVGPIRGFALALGIATIFDLLFTRLYTRNVVPIVVSRINNTRFLFPIKNKDITNV